MLEVCAAHLGLNLGHGKMCISCMRWGVWEQVLRCVQQAILSRCSNGCRAQDLGNTVLVVKRKALMFGNAL